jgi:hypothetical protein
MWAAHASAKAGRLPPRLNFIHFWLGSASALNDQMMSPDSEDILAWIEISYICRRDPRDIRENDLTMEELDNGPRVCDGERLEDDIDDLFGSEQYAIIWNIFSSGTGVGWKEWQSIPLASNADVLTNNNRFSSAQRLLCRRVDLYD